MCYVHNQWYDISCATLYTQTPTKCPFSDDMCTFATLQYATSCRIACEIPGSQKLCS